MGLLMACVVLFASYEIYSDVLLLEEEEETTRCLAAASKTVAASAPAGTAANTGYLVFFSEFSPKTNRRRDRMGFYMRQFGADGTLHILLPLPPSLAGLPPLRDLNLARAGSKPFSRPYHRYMLTGCFCREFLRPLRPGPPTRRGPGAGRAVLVHAGWREEDP